jgi:type I restriction enzyme S subunit
MIQLMVAPRLDEQIAISSFLSDMDAELVALEWRLCKARQVKEGMMQQLLTGKIRLK